MRGIVRTALFPCVAKVMGLFVSSRVEVVNFRLPNGEVFHYSLNGTSLEGWALRWSSDPRTLIGSWCEIGFCEDSSGYIEILLAPDEFDAVHSVFKQYESEQGYAEWKEAHRVPSSISPEMTLYYGKKM